MFVVIPSNRGINLSYLQPLIDYGANFIIIYDSDETLKIKHPSFEVFNWIDRKKILGKLDCFFPRKNGACRNFGFYLAYKSAKKNEIIVALDDDCKIECTKFPGQVEQVLGTNERVKIKNNNNHFNILSLYKNIDSNLFPRGFPYQQRGNNNSETEKEYISCKSDFNLGLWSGVFDANAIDKIDGPEWKHTEIKLKHDNVLIPKDVLVSVCSMNMQFRKELIPFVFQFPMNVQIFRNWKINRYGDIWGGLLLKSLMDIKEDIFTVGTPVVHHTNSNGYLQYVPEEHLAHLVNEEMINIITESCMNVKRGDYLDMYAQAFENIKKQENISPILKEYFKILFPAMNAWIESLS